MNNIKEFLKSNLKTLPLPIKRRIKRLIRPKFLYLLWPRIKPISDYYGADRGQAIGRYYENIFLQQFKDQITGACLEILDGGYTQQYGHDVTNSDILDIDTENKIANIHGDIRGLREIKDNTYDCIILTQVLQYIDNLDLAIASCKRVLKPGGVFLVTLPFLGRIDCVAKEDGDFWRFTIASARYLFKPHFNNLEIRSMGNVKSSMFSWIGLSREEISKKDLDYYDKNFPCIITVKAVK